MPRVLPFIVTAACCISILTICHYSERLNIASALLATFFKFAASKRTIISIGDVAQDAVGNERPVVPSIIHQIKLGNLVMIPAWHEARKSCQELHPEWTFNLWQDEEANEFVRKQYPQIYHIYRGYSQEIQRSNVLRYLVLDHYGGMYLDLDLRCRQSLEFLRNESFITPPANPTGVNNAFIVSIRGHPFWSLLIQELPRYNLNWSSPYLTNMFSTGCHFFSTIHRTYSGKSPIKILDSSNKLNGHVTTPLFEHLGASTWHKGDARFVLQLGKGVEIIKRSARLMIAIVLVCVISITALIIFTARRSRTRRRNDLFSNETDEENAKLISE